MFDIFSTDNKEAVLMVIDRNTPMVDDALKELDEVGYFILWEQQCEI